MAGSEVLSQAEIDALLSAISTGVVSPEEIKTEQPPRIKPYDFKRPDKFSKDQIRTLDMLHENFARFLNTYLAMHLRTIVHLDLVSVDQLSYEDFIQSVPNPSVISIFQMQPLKGNAILEINPNIVFAIIDRLFGGPGLPPVKSRPLTDIETAIVKRVIGKMLESLQEAWKQVTEFEPKLEGFETNPQFTQIVPPNDIVAVVTIQAKIGQAEGLINLCLPHLVLEPIIPKLTTSYWIATGSRSSVESATAVQRKLEKTQVPLIVELGQLSLAMGELINLGKGDVLQLDTNVNSELKLLVGPNRKFTCKPGLSGKRLAIQITSKVAEGDDVDE